MGEARVIRIEPTRLYWAELDLPPRAGTEAARSAFEEYLPIPIEDVHAVFARGDAGRTVACGLPRAVAESLVRGGALLALPTAVPEWAGRSVAPEALSLLVGEFVPRRVRLWRRLAAAVLLLALVAVCGAITIGAERRRAAAGVVEANALREAEALVAACGAGGADGLPAAVRLGAAVREARAALERVEDARRVGDASPLLTGVLRTWPRDVPTRTDLIRVESTGVTISARLPDTAQAGRLAEALRGAPGLTLEPAQVALERDGVHVQLRLRPSGGSP